MTQEHGDGDQPVTRRELDQRLTALQKHIDLRFDAQADNRESEEKALVLQRGIYEERLERLNGEEQRIATVLEQSVPREVFENYKEEQRIWREQLTKQMNDERDARRKELADDVQPLKNKALIDSGKDLGLLGIGLTVGGLVAAAVIQMLGS